VVDQIAAAQLRAFLQVQRPVIRFQGQLLLAALAEKRTERV
jgi:hypothetical protein